MFLGEVAWFVVNAGSDIQIPYKVTQNTITRQNQPISDSPLYIGVTLNQYWDWKLKLDLGCPYNMSHAVQKVMSLFQTVAERDSFHNFSQKVLHYHLMNYNGVCRAAPGKASGCSKYPYIRVKISWLGHADCIKSGPAAFIKNFKMNKTFLIKLTLALKYHYLSEFLGLVVESVFFWLLETLPLWK